MWRHDPPGQIREPGQPLVSCDGSLAIVDLPLPGRQMELDIPGLDGGAADTPAAVPPQEPALF